MLMINTRNNKLAAARVDFASRGMLLGTCLGAAIQLQCHELGITTSGLDDDDNDDNEFGGLDGNGEGGGDLDLDDDDNEDDGAPGPVDGPPVFSEVVLVRKRGAKVSIPRTGNSF